MLKKLKAVRKRERESYSLSKRRFQKYQNINSVLIKAYKKISLVLCVQKKIGYIKGVSNKENVYKMKEIKLLHDSLSFL